MPVRLHARFWVLWMSNVSTKSQDNFLRINADKVGRLMDLVGELGLVSSEIINHPELEGLELKGFDSSAHRLEGLIREIQDESSGLRLVPVGSVFKRMQRLVRDVSKQINKEIALVLIGEDTEVDKVIVDRLYDPLVHLVRNSADHGLENPEERRKAGKSEKGTITLAAYQQGGEVQILIKDDGKGMNREAILGRAVERGLIGADEDPDDETVWNFIFDAGFSTNEQVSKLSGRGVGMDVVKTSIQDLRGRIEIKSQQGLGSTLTLRIPLTLAFLDAMVVRQGNRLYAIPVDVVSEAFKVQEKQVTTTAVDGSEVIRVRDALVPVLRLEDFYQEDHDHQAIVGTVVVLVHTSHGEVALPIDEIVSQQQVTMKPLQGQLKQIRAGVGCAMLASGDIAIALDCERFFS